MRKLLINSWFLLLLVLTSEAQEKSSFGLIPAPVKMEVMDGLFSVSPNISVKLLGFRSDTSRFHNFANRIFSTVGSNQTEPGLTIDISSSFPIKEEGYRLSINKTGITIKALTEKGAFYGLQTLSQLWFYNGVNSRSLPFVEIEDYPRFSYRGLHLDVGRHLFPTSFIKEYIDILAYYKLNTFHWHLTEDQGWRIEIKKYPKLAQIGGFRAQTLIGYINAKPQQFDNTRYGGYYTQEEIKEVVAYAASKYITVIPEIEMPGHALAALSAYPELGCGNNPGPFKAAEKWGVFDDVFCAGKESTFKFLEDVLDEILPLFPSPYIHIGGDECPKVKWKTCELCQKRITKEKLKDEHALQSYFVHRIEKYLNKKGRNIIGWDEILEGGLAPNATVMSWRGTKGGIEAAKQSHNVIMAPSPQLYFDRRENKSLAQEPVGAGGWALLPVVYSYNPVPNELTKEEQEYVIGVQANVWTEYLKTPARVRYQVYPRVFALSEIAWTSLENKDWKDFHENRMPQHLGKLDAEKVVFRVPDPIGAKDTTLIGSNFTFTYRTPVTGAEIYYTLNGTPPFDVDYLYDKEINISVPPGEERTLKSIVITASGRRSSVVTTLMKNTE